MVIVANQPNTNNSTISNRVKGYTIDTLNSMTYVCADEVDSNEYESNSIPCTYKLPNQVDVRTDKLSVMSFNIRSMKKNFDNFKAELLDSIVGFDILGLCETRLTDATEKLYKLKGYNMFTANVCANMGGVCIYVKDNISCNIRKDLGIIRDHIEIIFVECNLNDKDLLIRMLYRRPGSDSDRFIEDLVTTLNKIKKIVIVS